MIGELLLASALCAAVPEAPACLAHECSNDAAPLELAGDDGICFGRVEGAASYRLIRDGVVCAEFAPRWRMMFPGQQQRQQLVWIYAWPLCAPWREGEVARLELVACDHAGACSAPAGPVTFHHLDYACFDAAAGGRVPCYPGDPMEPIR